MTTYYYPPAAPRVYKPRQLSRRCEKPLASNRANDDYCARPAGHRGQCKGAQALNRRRWPRTIQYQPAEMKP